MIPQSIGGTQLLNGVFFLGFPFAVGLMILFESLSLFVIAALFVAFVVHAGRYVPVVDYEPPGPTVFLLFFAAVGAIIVF